MFTTSDYRKPSFSGVYTHLSYKFRLVSTIIFGTFTICSDILPSVGMILTELKVKLHKTFKQLLPPCDLRVIFKVSLRMKNYFNFKDKIKQELRSLLVCNFKCNSCNAEYIGKKKRHYRTRTSELIGVLPLTGKCIKNNSQT